MLGQLSGHMEQSLTPKQQQNPSIRAMIKNVQNESLKVPGDSVTNF